MHFDGPGNRCQVWWGKQPRDIRVITHLEKTGIRGKQSSLGVKNPFPRWRSEGPRFLEDLGQATSDKEVNRKNTSPSLAIHHKKPEDIDKCHKISRPASSSSHTSNQGLHTNFLAHHMPGQPGHPILQLKVNISSTLWLLSPPGPWM